MINLLFCVFLILNIAYTISYIILGIIELISGERTTLNNSLTIQGAILAALLYFVISILSDLYTIIIILRYNINDIHKRNIALLNALELVILTGLLLIIYSIRYQANETCIYSSNLINDCSFINFTYITIMAECLYRLVIIIFSIFIK